MNSDYRRPYTAAFSLTKNPIFRFFTSGGAINNTEARSSRSNSSTATFTQIGMSKRIIGQPAGSKEVSDGKFHVFGNSRNVEMSTE